MYDKKEVFLLNRTKPRQNRPFVNVTLKILSAALLILPLGVTAVYGSHCVRLGIEKKRFPAPGTLVQVNGHSMHVYSEGERAGSGTLVFLSGSGTACPFLDFKSLYSKLTGTYRVAVVERPGYGYSDSAVVPRDVGSILEETRAALRLAGETGPFVLFPHSLSGLEALYWAQRYPEEVSAIIGLDAAVPETYLQIGPETLQKSIRALGGLSVLSRLGLCRLIPHVCESDPALTGSFLSGPEKEMYRAAVYRSFLTPDVIREGEKVYENARTVAAGSVPVKTPMLFFISNGQDVGYPNWQSPLTAYMERLENGRYRVLDCGHYVHSFLPEQIASESRRFLDTLQ